MYLDAIKQDLPGIPPDLGFSTESVLRSLATDFASAPLANGRRMRELMQLNSDEFRRCAVALLRGESEGKGCRYLLTLLWTNGLLLPVLADENLPIERALASAQVAAEVDPQLHIRITRYLIATTLEQQTIGENEATRLLQILASINDSVSLQPFIRQMLLHPSPRIRSKLSLLIGRSQSGNRSLATLLSDRDSRVRANAVEALWNNSNPDICALVRLALDDTNNRVVGNAILGLYFAGMPVSIAAALKLTGHPEPLFRATAVWAMGKTRDPRFLPCLGRLLAESSGQLRKTVFGAISYIKQAAAARQGAPPLRVSILNVTRRANGKTRVRAAVIAGALAQPAEIPATGFIVETQIETQNVPINDYFCEARTSDLAYLALSLPRETCGEQEAGVLERAVKACLTGKRSADLWAIARYSNAAATQEGAPRAKSATFLGQTLNEAENDPSLPAKQSYTADAVALSRALETKGGRFESDQPWLDSLRGLIAGTPAGPGSKNVIAVVVLPDPIPEERLAPLIESARAHRVSIHVVCARPSPELFRLSDETSGCYRELAVFDDMQAELETICASVIRLYQLDFEEVPNTGTPDALSLQVHLPAATGKCLWTRRFGAETKCPGDIAS